LTCDIHIVVDFSPAGAVTDCEDGENDLVGGFFDLVLRRVVLEAALRIPSARGGQA